MTAFPVSRPIFMGLKRAVVARIAATKPGGIVAFTIPDFEGEWRSFAGEVLPDEFGTPEGRCMCVRPIPGHTGGFGWPIVPIWVSTWGQSGIAAPWKDPEVAEFLAQVNKRYNTSTVEADREYHLNSVGSTD